MEPQERRNMLAGVVVAVVIVVLLGGARAWLGSSAGLPVITLVVIVAWGAWLFWSRRRGGS